MEMTVNQASEVVDDDMRVVRLVRMGWFDRDLESNLSLGKG